MSVTAIFVVGCCVFGLCLAFVVVSARELRRLGREADARAAVRSPGGSLPLS